MNAYVLVGDAAYPCQPWMLIPFKGHKDGFTREEYPWNYVQSSTQMYMDRAFGMLEGRWRIILNMMDVHLKNVFDLVSTCLLLHNICTIFGDNFWKNEWLEETFNDVHNVLAMGTATCASRQERLAVANHAFYTHWRA